MNVDPSDVVAAAEEIAHQAYIDAMAAEVAPQGAEQGMPSRPVREGNMVNDLESIPNPDELTAYAARDGRPIDLQNSEAVLAETANIISIYDAPEVEATKYTQEHNRAAIERALAFSSRVTDMQTAYLDHQEAINPAPPRKKSMFDLAA